MDYTIATVIQDAVNNYDVSDILNQTIIILLMAFLFVQARVRIKFNTKTYY
jgi:hypothetical protein